MSSFFRLLIYKEHFLITLVLFSLSQQPRIESAYVFQPPDRSCHSSIAEGSGSVREEVVSDDLGLLEGEVEEDSETVAVLLPVPADVVGVGREESVAPDCLLDLVQQPLLKRWIWMENGGESNSL